MLCPEKQKAPMLPQGLSVDRASPVLETAEAAPGTASLLLPRVVDELLKMIGSYKPEFKILTNRPCAQGDRVAHGGPGGGVRRRLDWPM
jgi:hypothetical protein